MYAIGNIIYGIPYSEKVLEFFENNDLLDPEEYFEFVYSGSGDIPAGWCGIVLDRINECSNIRFKDLKSQPSEQDVQKALSKIDNLPEEIKNLSDPPDVYIVWSTS